jgi:hypothetical protein
VRQNLNAEIIRTQNELNREVWEFYILFDYAREQIHLGSYDSQTRKSKRHVWKTRIHWEAIDKRTNTIKDPPIPDDVAKEIREHYKTIIDTLPIVK